MTQNTTDAPATTPTADDETVTLRPLADDKNLLSGAAGSCCGGSSCSSN